MYVTLVLQQYSTSYAKDSVKTKYHLKMFDRVSDFHRETEEVQYSTVQLFTSSKEEILNHHIMTTFFFFFLCEKEI